MASIRKFSRQVDGYIHKFRFNGHREERPGAIAPIVERAQAASIGRKFAQILTRNPARSLLRLK